MKVAMVTGGRDYKPTAKDKEDFLSVIDTNSIAVLIHGGCRGVDQWAAGLAAENGLWVVCVPAPWKRHGKAAGPKRNVFMARLAGVLSGVDHDLLCIALPGGAGTRNAVASAESRGSWTVAIGSKEVS